MEELGEYSEEEGADNSQVSLSLSTQPLWEEMSGVLSFWVIVKVTFAR